MRLLTMLALSAGAALAVASAAQAEGGCGPGFHRGPGGACHPNGPRGPVVVGPGPVVVAPGRWVVGTYYPGHGYWDGHRWWTHRYSYHGGWRYR
jgi:hypothetical protein